MKKAVSEVEIFMEIVSQNYKFFFKHAAFISF